MLALCGCSAIKATSYWQQTGTACAVTTAPLTWLWLAAVQVKKAPPPEPSAASGPSETVADGDAAEGEGQIAIGKLRGEDYNFEFQGKVKEGKMHFRLFMTQVGTLEGCLGCAVRVWVDAWVCL